MRSSISCTLLGLLFGAVAICLALANPNSVTFSNCKGIEAAMSMTVLFPIIFAVIGYFLGFVVRLLMTDL
jgi:hypothetical protein